MNTPKKFHLLPLALSSVFLSACGGAPSTENPPPARVLLSSVEFPNPALKQCVNQAAGIANIIYVDELKVLNCNSGGHGLYLGDSYKSGTQAVVNTSGLEKLTAIESLNLGHNWISKIDLSNFSHLTTLELSENAIQELDLTKLKSLKTLTIHCNPLEKLQLPVDGVLEELKFGSPGSSCENPSQLDLAANAMAEGPLDIIHGGRLKSSAYDQARKGLWLDLRNQKSLKRISLIGLDLGDFNFSSLPAVNSVEILNVYSSRLTSIDISNLLNLKELMAGFNPLSSLNAKNNSKLKIVDISSNKIQSSSALQLPDGIEQLSFFGNADGLDIYRSPSLKSLVISGHFDGANTAGLENLESLVIDGAVVNRPLALPKLKIFSGGGESISPLDFSRCPSLENATLFVTSLDPLDFRGANNLTYLSVSTDSLRSIDFSTAPKLAGISLNSNSLTLDGIRWPTALKSLSVSEANWDLFSSQGITNLTDLTLESPIKNVDLRGFMHLKNLHISGVPIGELDLIPIASTIEELWISDCPIVDLKGARMPNLQHSILFGLKLSGESESTFEQNTGVFVQ